MSLVKHFGSQYLPGSQLCGLDSDQLAQVSRPILPAFRGGQQYSCSRGRPGGQGAGCPRLSLEQSQSKALETTDAGLFCSCSVAKSRPALCDPHGQKHTRLLCPSLSRSLLKPMSIVSVMPSNHLILCRPLLLLPPIFPSIRVFSNELALCIRLPK